MTVTPTGPGLPELTTLDLLRGGLAGSTTGLRFANPDWHSHLASLKPIGLNLLLNNLCRNTSYSREFGTHLAAVDLRSRGRPNNQMLLSRFRSATAPRRCLCRVAREIGFSMDTVHKYTPLQVIVTTAPGRSLAINEVDVRSVFDEVNRSED